VVPVDGASPGLLDTAAGVLGLARHDDVAVHRGGADGRRRLAVTFAAPGCGAAVVAEWPEGALPADAKALLEDAAHSLRLALEREEATVAHQEALTLRRSQELQRGFLSRLSHELRTPLTAIRGYASSLMQPDVTWDRESQQRFLDRIAAESARLGRLVDDLLDFSAIESGTMRLQGDWCDIRLVLEAAIACLPPASAASVVLSCDPHLPVVWADHDRMEQVFVNLLNNAFRHNPPGTRVRVTADHRMSEVVIGVLDDGDGMSPELAATPFEPARRPRAINGNGNGNGNNNGNGHRKSVGAGLGLSIAKGIVQAHGGRIELTPLPKGTCFQVYLPVEAEVDAGRLAANRRDHDGDDD
jgi:signal transduction histidine kinase